MKLLITFILTAALAVPALAIDLKGNADFTSTYDSKGGKVLFPHGLHAKKLSKKCHFCHSALRTFGGINQMYGHKVCEVCHEQSGRPSSCHDCHHQE